MRGKPIRVVAALAAIVLAGFAVAYLARDDKPAGVAAVDMNHGDVKFANGELQRILNAVDTTTSQVAADQLVAQGRKIFRDASLFENGESCQTCHAEGSASAKLGTIVHDTAVKRLDPQPVPAPPSNFDGPRDPPSLWNVDKTPPYFWNGNGPTLAAAIAGVVHGHMKLFVTGDCKTPSADCDTEAGRRAAALTAYVKTLKPPETSFDDGTMSDAAKRGEKLFQGKGGCIECHGGPNFTDNLVHNTGVPQVDFTTPYRPDHPMLNSLDLGAPAPPVPAECAGTPAPAGCEPATSTEGLPCPPVNQVVKGRCSAFVNTPQMRDLKDTPPYMHNGAFTTLKQVVQFYNTQSSLSPLNLTGPEIDDLVAYLESL